MSKTCIFCLISTPQKEMTLFTSREPYRSQWIHRLSRNDEDAAILRREVDVPTKKYLCLKHFPPEAFIHSNTHLMLRPDAVPRSQVSSFISRYNKHASEMYKTETYREPFLLLRSFSLRLLASRSLLRSSRPLLYRILPSTTVLLGLARVAANQWTRP